MSSLRLAARGVLVVAALSAHTPRPASAPILFEGGRLIVDARRPPIENAALLVDHGRTSRPGAKGT